MAAVPPAKFGEGEEDGEKKEDESRVSAGRGAPGIGGFCFGYEGVVLADVHGREERMEGMCAV